MRYWKQFSVKKHVFASALKLDHIPILLFEQIPLDNDSFFPVSTREWETLKDRVADGKRWFFCLHSDIRPLLRRRRNPCSRACTSKLALAWSAILRACSAARDSFSYSLLERTPIFRDSSATAFE